MLGCRAGVLLQLALHVEQHRAEELELRVVHVFVGRHAHQMGFADPGKANLRARRAERHRRGARRRRRRNRYRARGGGRGRSRRGSGRRRNLRSRNGCQRRGRLRGRRGLGRRGSLGRRGRARGRRRRLRARRRLRRLFRCGLLRGRLGCRPGGRLLHCGLARHCSSPCTKRSWGRLRPMKTSTLARRSAGSHGLPRSPPMSMCTPWNTTRCGLPSRWRTPL